MQSLQPDLSGALFMKRSGIKKRESRPKDERLVCPNHHLKIFSRVEIIIFDDDVDELSFSHFGGINF